MKNQIFDKMYNIIHEDCISRTQFENDKVFTKAIEQFIKITSNEFLTNVSSTEINLHEIPETDTIVGIIILQGPTGKVIHDVKDSIRIIEKRILGSEKDYYLFIIIRALGKKDDVISDSYFKRCIVDGYSRIIDYYLDSIEQDEEKMTCLNKRDNMNTNAPEIIIAKILLLYGIKEVQSLFEQQEKEPIESDSQKSANRIILFDSLIIQNARLDWLSSNSYHSNDKMQVFLPQLELMSELFTFASSIDNESFHEIYSSLFNQGCIYELSVEEFKWINRFIALGVNAFSTKALNEVWEQYI